MIIKEFFMTRPDGVDLYRSYSDQGVRIRCDQTGAVYDEAVNVFDSGHTYTEMDEPIAELTDSEALDIIMGRDANEQQDSNEIA